MALKNEPFKKLGGILKQMLPTVLAGATGPAAPMIFAIAKSILGDKADNEGGLAEAIETALTSEDGRAKLKELELAAQKLEAETGIKFADIEAGDRADARARQVALKDNTPAIVLYLTTVGFYGVLGSVLWRGLPENGGEVLLMMIGALGSAWGASVQYFVGSSAGSTAKTAILGK